jgi:hypothetical protein
MAFAVSHIKSNTLADWSGQVTVGNSTGGTATVQATDLVRPVDWNSVHTFGVETGFFEPFVPQNTNSSLSAPGIGTWYLEPIILPHGLDSGQLNFLVADAAGFLNGSTLSRASTGSITRYQTLNHMFALYARDSGANSTRLTTIWSRDNSILATWERRFATNVNTATMSNYLTLSFPMQFDVSGGVTYSSTSQSGTRSSSTSTTGGTIASSFGDSLITGAIAYLSGSKYMPVPFATKLPPDNYWLGHMVTSTSSSTGTNYSTGTMFSTQSYVHNLEFVGQAYKKLGVSVSNTSSIYQGGFHGSVATVSSLPVTSLATSDMRNLVTNARLYWNYHKTTY